MAPSDTAAERKTVTVVGLGLMGSALAHAFANAGYDLTVWNRTAEKAKPFAGIARVARTVSDACTASTTVIMSLLDYQVSEALLSQAEVEEALAGKYLVQLSTGTPVEARHTDAWARRHGIVYLDGAIMAYPRAIGRAHTLILYAGPQAAFNEQRVLLSALGGRPTWCGEAIGAAAALDLALLDVFFGVAAALLHGAALCAAESLPLESFFEQARGWLQAVAGAAVSGVESGQYPRGNSTMVMSAASIRHIVRASKDGHIDASFPSALLGWFVRAIERGHGADDVPSLYEAFRRP